MNKKRIFLLFILLIVYQRIYTHAEIKDVGFIDIQVELPRDFETGLMINFTLEDGTNALYTLNPHNGYKLQQQMPVGRHTLDFINLYNDIKGEYEISSEKVIVIEKNKGTLFDVFIDKRITDKEVGEKINEFLGVAEDTDVNTISQEEVEALEGEYDYKEEIVTEDLQKEKIEGSGSFIRRNLITIVILLILVLVLLLMKLKEIIYKS